MTTVTLTMPRLGETMEEGTVSGWHVTEGQTFERGAVLMEFETDKTSVEYPALGSGRLVKVLVRPGDQVKPGEALAEIDLEGTADWTGQSDKSNEKEETAQKENDGEENDRKIIDLLMPRLGETMEEGRITAWTVPVGVAYSRGTPLLEIETDKTVAEFPALVAGRLVEILARSGETIDVGKPIARIEVSCRDATGKASRETIGSPAREEKESTDSTMTASPTAEPGNKVVPVRATPLARRAAQRAGLRLEDIQGTGRRGRIELADIRRTQIGAQTSAQSAMRVGAAGRLAESVQGPEGGVPLLLVHGFAGDRTTFEQLGKGLGQKGFFVRAVDLPSHGKTAQEATRFDDLVTALSAELNPQQPVHLVGHSLGAAAAIAATARVGGARSLTLIAPAGLGLTIDSTFIEGMAEAASPGTIRHLLHRLSERTTSFSPEIISRIHADLARGRLRALAADICHNGRQSVHVRTELARLAGELPVRLLLGCRDQILDWREAAELSPAIAVHLFARAGHMPHWDVPEATATIITRSITPPNADRT